jgi:hypothetical protein
MNEIIEIIIETHVLPSDSVRILNTLHNPVTLFYVKIDLTSYSNVLKMILEFTYAAESYGWLFFNSVRRYII